MSNRKNDRTAEQKEINKRRFIIGSVCIHELIFSLQDYHVILVRKCQGGESHVYDLDSILAFPCHITDYANQVLRSNKGLKKHFHRYELLDSKVI